MLCLRIIKRIEHIIDPGDIELTELEMRLILGGDTDKLDLITGTIFCTCEANEKRLMDYTPYLNNLNDLVLRGLCSGCKKIAARYVETGEDPESCAVAERIKVLKKEGVKK